MQRLGILGVGELTEKVVIGLRRSGFDGAIRLSPRNRERSAALAEKWRCQVMDSNQAVVDGSDLLIVGVRPDALEALASEVSLSPGQGLVSLIAGASLAELSKRFPGARCIRAMLSYAAQINQSMVVVCPPDEPSENVLGKLGSLAVLTDERHFELATVAACMNGWFYFLLHDLQQWFADKGLPAATSRELVLGHMQDCLASARLHPEVSLQALGQAIATPGTFTARGLDLLEHRQASAPWGDACDVTLEALTRR